LENFRLFTSENTKTHRQSFSLVPREELAGADYERVAWDEL